ncbi:hypothetical protein [Ralstonia pseudosolanacearum]|uniref:hypothetical protein n=1 Tax=Ralstonia pseudosolanacearum TaxID=1310165 RepID=UPI001FFC0EA3|nr:hypothetical protein [Ralstonia pseudosolanacearum]
MRKFLFAAALLTLSTFAIEAQAQFRASDYCNMKRSPYEREQCIEYGARGSMLRVKGNTQRLLDSSKVPQPEKQSVLKSHKKWASQLESKCSDNACYWNMASDRNNEIERLMAKYGLNPI